MANIAISALPAASTVASADLTVIVQGGVTKQATISQLPSGTGALAAGYTQLVNGQNYIDVVFASAQADTNWETQCSVVNTADTTPLNIWPGITTARTTTGFRLQLNGAPDTSNYYLQWAINASLALPGSVPATALTLSGPSGGLVSVASTNFTVALSPVGGTVTGTITVTPSSGGGGGTFTPATVGLTTAAPSATFTYTPASTGAKTISVTNSGTLTNPGSLTYTVTNTATALTLTGPSSGIVSVASTNFTVALSPVGGTVTGTVTVTENDSSGGGAFTPTTVGLTTASPSGTFTYTPGSTGAKTIGVTNSGGLTNPTSLTYTSNAAATPHLLNTLISYWKFDEATGPWNDTVGTNHFTATVPPTSVTGKINSGVNFITASAQYVTVASNSSLQVTSDFTLSVWVNPGLATGGHILGKSLPATDTDYQLFIGGGGEAVFGVGTITLGSQYAISPTGSFVVGAWTHVVAWYDHLTGQLYVRVNDSTTSQSTAALPLAQTTGALDVGIVPGSTDYLTGIVDELGFWKRVLTPTEITALYNGGAGLAYSSFTT